MRVRTIVSLAATLLLLGSGCNEKEKEATKSPETKPPTEKLTTGDSITIEPRTPCTCDSTGPMTIAWQWPPLGAYVSSARDTIRFAVGSGVHFGVPDSGCTDTACTTSLGKQDSSGILIDKTPGPNEVVTVDNAVPLYWQNPKIPVKGLRLPPYTDTLPPGNHIVRTFLCRGFGESIKDVGGFAISYFRIGPYNSHLPAIDTSGPILTYNEPTGSFGPGASVPLDFFLKGATLGSDSTTYKVRVSVDNVLIATLTSWTPYCINGLSSGNHTIKIELYGPGLPAPNNAWFQTSSAVITVNQPSIPRPR